MSRQRLLVLLAASCATLSVSAQAAETPPSLSVRPTVFAGSNDLDRGVFGASLHLGITGRTQELAPGLTAEVELSLFASQDLGLTDNSSYLRFLWRPSGWGEAEGLALTLFPLHADRLYLGFEFPLTDRLAPPEILPGARSGLELRLTRSRWYAFVAAKSEMVNDTEDRDPHRGYTELVGAGVDLLPALRIEAEAVHADLGANMPATTNGMPLDRSESGAAARLSFHRGSAIGPPADFQRYAGDPALWENLLQSEQYDDALSTSLSAELLYLSRSGLTDSSFKPASQSGVGAAIEGRAKWKRLRGFLRAQVQTPELYWTYGLLENERFADLATLHDELRLLAAADYSFPGTGLTPGLSVEVTRPGWMLPLPTAPQPNAFPVVLRSDGTSSVLPTGADVELTSRLMASLRWDRGPFSALADVFLQHDPNRTQFVDSGTGVAEPTFARATSFGFDLMLQTRF